MIPADFPTIQELYECIIEKAQTSSGEITNAEFEAFVIEKMRISNEYLSVIHSGKRSELNYRLAWARTKATKMGKLQRVSSGVWKPC